MVLLGGMAMVPESPEAQRATAARISTRVAVKHFLTAPATADFGQMRTSVGHNHGVVEGSVTATNAFGVPSESRYMTIGVVNEKGGFDVALVVLDGSSNVYSEQALAAYRIATETAEN